MYYPTPGPSPERGGGQRKGNHNPEFLLFDFSLILIIFASYNNPTVFFVFIGDIKKFNPYV